MVAQLDPASAETDLVEQTAHALLVLLIPPINYTEATDFMRTVGAGVLSYLEGAEPTD